MPDIIRFLHSRKSSKAAILRIATLDIFPYEYTHATTGFEQRLVSFASTLVCGFKGDVTLVRG